MPSLEAIDLPPLLSLGVSDDLHMPGLTPILTSKALCISHACMPLSPCVKSTPGMCVSPNTATLTYVCLRRLVFSYKCALWL